MDVEFILKLISAMAAILAIAERVYCYSPKIYQKLKGDQPRQILPVPPKSLRGGKALAKKKFINPTL